MSETPSNASATTGPITIVVETEDNKKFKIATADLATAAAQLRPKAAFSAFNSIIVPIGVTILTAIVTTGVGQFFQWVSWRNSVVLQEAHDRVARATAAYDKAAAAIGVRYYATYVFLDAIKDLVNRKDDVDSHLYRLDLELNKRRFDDYYGQLKRWNETNEQILTEIDFALDRPVGIEERKRFAQMSKIDCTKSMTEQLAAQNLRPGSLKLQFAVITRCFGGGLPALSAFMRMKDRASSDPASVVDAKLATDAEDALNDVNSSANIFRCYALSRIDFLRSREGRAIYIPKWLAYFRPGGTNEAMEAREKDAHFKHAEKTCQ